MLHDIEAELAPAARQRLARLAERARTELALTAHPSADWMPTTVAPDGRAALDVLVIGAGQGGQAVTMALRRARVDAVLAVDRAPRGREGPWMTYARMHTLRSPKQFTGPDLDLPSLTYQAWHCACFGDDSWQRLDLIPRQLWASYLLWVREVAEIPVENDTEVVAVRPLSADADTLFEAVLEGPAVRRLVFARKIVLATGQDGVGRWMMPDFLERLPAHLRAHAADPIDFDALAGTTVAVLGAGASAADNAAVALEHGAKAVHMFVRRERMQRIQPYRWLTFRGFLEHLCDLEDPWRWRFMQRVLAMRESIPQDTYTRMRRFEQFHIHVGCAWSGARTHGDGLLIDTSDGPFHADFAIAGTGMDVDLTARPELAAFAGKVKTWADAYTPPPAESDERLGRFPYLDRNGAFMERAPGTAPYLRNVHDFTIAATMSFGPSGASINAMTTAVPRLVRGITRGLFAADVAHHWADFQSYDVPVFELAPPDLDK